MVDPGDLSGYVRRIIIPEATCSEIKMTRGRPPLFTQEIEDNHIIPKTETCYRIKQSCAVCLEDANGTYFGAVVCLPCKSFFIRCTKETSPRFHCSNKGRCDISRTNRLSCQFCRFTKCLAVGMCRKEKPESVEPGEGQELCRVCADIANGVHFGVATCEGCKKFFRRALKESKSYTCKYNRLCRLNPRNRNSCRYCRYQKCISMGMSRNAIRMGRPRKKDINESMLKQPKMQYMYESDGSPGSCDEYGVSPLSTHTLLDDNRGFTSLSPTSPNSSNCSPPPLQDLVGGLEGARLMPIHTSMSTSSMSASATTHSPLPLQCEIKEEALSPCCNGNPINTSEMYGNMGVTSSSRVKNTSGGSMVMNVPKQEVEIIDVDEDLDSILRTLGEISHADVPGERATPVQQVKAECTGPTGSSDEQAPVYADLLALKLQPLGNNPSEDNNNNNNDNNNSVQVPHTYYLHTSCHEHGRAAIGNPIFTQSQTSASNDYVNTYAHTYNGDVTNKMDSLPSVTDAFQRRPPEVRLTHNPPYWHQVQQPHPLLNSFNVNPSLLV